MTRVTKEYVELSDVVAFVVECRHCGAVLSIRVNDFGAGLPVKCPMCTEAWVSPNPKGPTTKDQLLAFSDALKRLQRSLEKDNGDSPISLRLELSGKVIAD